MPPGRPKTGKKLRIFPVFAAFAKVSRKRGLWLIAREKRICLQQTYPLRSHSKKTSVLYPYIGIIQIRLRVWETHPTLSRLTASSPFPVLYYYSAVLFDFQVIFSWYQ